MARDHARVITAIWDDPDWRKLDQAAQHTYLMLASNKDISYCGVLAFVPGRFVDSVAGLTEIKFKSSIRLLEKRRYIVVDRKTQELLVRSFVRHDKILARRNIGNACARALGRVHSTSVREAVIHELARLYLEDSSREGWFGFKDFDAMAFDMTCAMAFDMESGEGVG